MCEESLQSLQGYRRHMGEYSAIFQSLRGVAQQKNKIGENGREGNGMEDENERRVEIRKQGERANAPTAISCSVSRHRSRSATSESRTKFVPINTSSCL